MAIMGRNVIRSPPGKPPGACAYALVINTENPPNLRRAESSRFYHAAPVRLEPLYVGGKGVGGDGIAQFRHQRVVIKQVVNGCQPGAQDFIDAVQVVQVAAAEIAARVTSA